MSHASATTTVLFVGDSVTDCGRRDDPEGLGHGYVRLLASTPEFSGRSVLNRGVNGSRVVDLEARWEEDVLSVEADVVSVLIGINDTWRRYDSDDPTSVEQYEAGYRRLLQSIAHRSQTSLVLLEPFLLPIGIEQERWREDLDSKIAAVRSLAAEFGAVLVPTDVDLTRLAAQIEEDERATALTLDGVHPTAQGHSAIAASWLTHAGRLLE
jgi:acyl-CoA thioesterase-1